MKFRFLALLALVLGLASCQNDPYGLEVDSKGEAAVTLNVALPDDATRAAGKDSAKGGIDNVDLINAYDIRYILEVYDEDGDLAKERMTEVKDTETSASFSFRLVPGRNYKFVVWADFVNQGSDGKEDLHYNTDAKTDANDDGLGLRNVTVITDNWTVIDESRDAYTGFKVVENFSSLSALTEPITLTRPFAKLRVVTNDIKEMISVRPAEVKVKYFNTKFYDTFDAFAETASGEYVFDDDDALTATLLDSQQNPVDVYSGGLDAQDGVQTLFADYFFGAEDDRVMFTMEVTDNGGVVLPKVTFNTNIPVKRNNLTTVYGPILTDSNNITVTINDAFENGPDWNPGDDKYDVEVISGPYTKTITLKTGNYFFKNVTVTTTTGPAIQIEESAVVTIDVQGILKLVGATDGIAVPNSSKLTINGISETRAEGKFGNLNVVAKGGYGIGGIGADVTIKNTTIDYICGWPVQPLFEKDLSYGKEEPEGFSAIGGAKITLDNVEIKKAEGGSKAAAIGNRYWQSTEINITNSILGDVFGGNASAAIGGSRYSSDATKHSVKINIDGTTIKNAVGGQFAAGIGAGYDTHCSANDSNAVNHIVITNSNITVKGGKYGAGIGTGYHSAALTGSIDAASTINATAGESREKYTLAQNIGYGVVDATREFKDANVTFTVAGVVIPSPVTYNNIVTVTTIEELQAALDAAKSGDNLIRFGADLVGNATIKQADKKNIILDGCGKKFDGVITVNGDGRSTGAETLTFTGINFETTYSDTNDENKWNFITAPSKIDSKFNYSHNVTIENCTFTNTVTDNYMVGSAAFTGTYNLVMRECSATNMHSMIQVQSCDNTAVVDGVTTENCKNGVAFGNTANATLKNSEIASKAYGVRGDGNASRGNLSIENTKITAAKPVIIRKMTTKTYAVAIDDTSVLTTTGTYHVIFTNGDDEGEFVEPTGEFTIDGADNYTIFPVKPVAKVGNTEYLDIDEAIANWTHNTTLTLLDNVTLNDVIKLKSTEHHILNLDTYTLTAASNKNAIEITPEGAGTAAKSCLTINANATNPGGIIAGSKACIYYKKTNGINDRLMVTINGGIYDGTISSSSNNGGQACPYFVFNGGVFNKSVSLTKVMLKVTGGVFHSSFSCTGDSTAYRLISGGTFKSWLFMTADAANKFCVGTAKETYDVGVYVDDEGYLVVGGPVITEFGSQFKAKATNATKWSNYLQYSSAAANGLYYTNAEMAIKKHGEANVVLP